MLLHRGGGLARRGVTARRRGDAARWARPLALRRPGRARPARYAREDGEAAAPTSTSPPPGAAPEAANPLELLRAERDPLARAALLRRLDGRWSDHASSYTPSAAERCIAQELNVWAQTLMVGRRADRRRGGAGRGGLGRRGG
jgi:hypothetical protein